MKIEDQVCNRELSNRLVALGVKRDSLFYWGNTIGQPDESCWRVYYGLDDDHAMEYIPTFTVAELGEILPTEYNQGLVQGMSIGFMKGDDYWGVFCPSAVFRTKTEADARASMLIYLIESGLVKP